MIAPGVGGRASLLEDEMVPALKGQKIANRKSGLSAADDDGVYVSGHSS